MLWVLSFLRSPCIYIYIYIYIEREKDLHVYVILKEFFYTNLHFQIKKKKLLTKTNNKTNEEEMTFVLFGISCMCI